MKKLVLRYGLFGGLIVAPVMIVSVMYGSHSGANMLLGYASMILAFSLIFVAVKIYRDKQNDGFINFAKAFKMGLLITLITSSIYVLAWLVCYYVFMPDFMEQYTSHVLQQAQESGAGAAEIAKQKAQMQQYSELYKNPLMVVLLTYAEIFPVGLVVSLIVALILKKKPKSNTVPESQLT